MMVNWLQNKVPHDYDLRWRYEYNDGTLEKYGQWSIHSKIDSDMACFTKSTNLARALIEYRNIRTMDQGVAAESPGQDFCLFQWEGCGVFPGLATTKMFRIASQPTATGIVGLTIVNRDERATVWRNGKVEAMARDPEEIKFNYAAYGK